MTDNSNWVFPAEEAPSKETAEFLMKCAVGNVLEELGFIDAIQNRLKFVLKNTRNAATEPTDDILIEIVAKFIDPTKYPDLSATMIEIAKAQCRAYATQDIKNKMVATQEWEDYFSILKVVIVSKMHNYDASRGKIVTFLRPFIMKEFFEARNEGTRYNSSMTKNSMIAKNQLMAEGIAHPDVKAIADRINMTMKTYKPVTPTQVKHALESIAYSVEVDENTTKSDDIYNPERHYLEEEKKELFAKAANSEHWAVKALFEVYKDYYFSDDPEALLAAVKKKAAEDLPDDIEDDDDDDMEDIKSDAQAKWKTKLPAGYLREAMYQKTGQVFSDVSIKNLLNSLQDVLEHKGFGYGYGRKKNRPSRHVVNTYVPDTTQLGDIERDIIEFDMSDDSDVKVYDLTNEVVSYSGRSSFRVK